MPTLTYQNAEEKGSIVEKNAGTADQAAILKTDVSI